MNSETEYGPLIGNTQKVKPKKDEPEIPVGTRVILLQGTELMTTGTVSENMADSTALLDLNNGAQIIVPRRLLAYNAQVR